MNVAAPTISPTRPALIPPAPGEPDVTGMLMAHLVFRVEFARLAGVAASTPAPGPRTDAIEEHIDFLSRVLHHHHTVEDTAIWPYLINRVPTAREVLDRLEAEHAQMDPLIDAITDRSTPLAHRGPMLEELSRLINEHLDYEEAHAVPMIRETYTAHDFELVEKQVMADLRRDTPRLIGVVSDHVSPTEFSGLLAGAPVVLTILWKLSWKRRWTKQARVLFTA
jgi:hemerythrin-like domain-containing protein